MTAEEIAAKEKADALVVVETKAKEAAEIAVKETVKTLNEKAEAAEKAAEKAAEASEKAIKELSEKQAATQKHADEIQVKLQGLEKSKTTQEKSFNEYLAETIEANADQIKGFKKGNAEQRFEMKAVGDMNIPANFPGSTPWTQDVRNDLIVTPYNRVWLGDILPNGSSTGSSVIYPKENGGEGAAAPWTDRTADKAQIDFDLTSTTAYFKWIAGFVIVDREMLDDITWLTSYLQNKMLISLKTAENDFILNGTTDTNPVQGLLDVATAYSGTETNRVNQIIDAGWGQIVEDTNQFYAPTHTIMTPRDSVKIGLNQAAGSGEYDLPAGSVAFVNGKLTVGGLEVVPTTQIGTGNFLTFDSRATMFIKRMQPELRMFEDATLAKKNRIMFRIEERATLATFNNSAIVSGTFADPA